MHPKQSPTINNHSGDERTAQSLITRIRMFQPRSLVASSAEYVAFASLARPRSYDSDSRQSPAANPATLAAIAARRPSRRLRPTRCPSLPRRGLSQPRSLRARRAAWR
eukprot:1608353-Prymnesium_polylepis.2